MTLVRIPARAPRQSGDTLNVTYRVARTRRPFLARWLSRELAQNPSWR